MKVLMVCLGNICRSPIAEGVLRHKAELNGLDYKVDSAGTAAYHVGEQPDPRMQLTAQSHGIDISSQRARQFSIEDFDSFDIIYAMDDSNYRDILSKAETDDERAKVKLLLNEYKPGSDMSVPDPWHGGTDGFERVFQLVDAACDNIIKND
ncbi:MAG: low molecular weight phosphotyrosine protein phosphatase [Flavobacteriales bacterium]|nr:low molecular weight phosphotyrosine protein phosphatase [Flavobacteriales bacterium]